MTTLSDVDDFRTHWHGHRCSTCDKPIRHSMAVNAWVHAFREDASADHNAVPAPRGVIVKRVNSSYVQAECQREDCDWRGQCVSTRTIEGYEIAGREAHEHVAAHENHTGFFHYQRGWVAS